MIPHILTLFEFISIPYENQHQTLNIKKIDPGQIKCRDYSITLLQPLHDERMSPIDFGGDRSNVKVPIDQNGYNFVNTIEIKPVSVF